MELTSPKLSTLNSNDLADAVADTVSRYGESLRAEFGWMDELSDSSLVVELGKRAVEGTLSENAEAYIWPSVAPEYRKGTVWAIAHAWTLDPEGGWKPSIHENGLPVSAHIECSTIELHLGETQQWGEVVQMWLPEGDTPRE